MMFTLIDRFKFFVEEENGDPVLEGRLYIGRHPEENGKLVVYMRVAPPGWLSTSFLGLKPTPLAVMREVNNDECLDDVIKEEIEKIAREVMEKGWKAFGVEEIEAY